MGVLAKRKKFILLAISRGHAWKDYILTLLW